MGIVSAALARLNDLSLFGAIALIVTAIFFSGAAILFLLGVARRWRAGQRLESVEWAAIGSLFLIVTGRPILLQFGLLTGNAQMPIIGVVALVGLMGCATQWRRWSRAATDEQRRIAIMATLTLVILLAVNILDIAVPFATPHYT